MKKLKPKEQAVLDYIIKTIDERGYSPTIRDIQTDLGYRSTSTVHLYLTRLEDYGYIQRDSGKSRTMKIDEKVSDLSGKIPLLGRVTAGAPILAVENFEGFNGFAADSTQYNRKNLFALRVKGTSMIEAGIFDGDVVVVDRRNFAENGEIVVAMVDDEATVKTFYKENGHYRLQPENSNMKPIIVDELSIIGKVIASIRYY